MARLACRFRLSLSAALLASALLALPAAGLCGELSVPAQGASGGSSRLGRALRFDPWASSLAASVARMASMRLFEGAPGGIELQKPEELAAAVLFPAGRGWLHLERSAGGELSVRFQTPWD